MPESTLSLTVDEIQAKLGTYAGWSRGAIYGETAWTVGQQAVITDATQSGLRRFYFPEPQGNSPESYCWSFMRPTITVTLLTGASAVDLPDDFGGIEGEVTVQLTTGAMWGPIKVQNPGVVDAQYMILPTTTGQPQMAAVVWQKGTTLTAGQRAQLYVWPLADQTYPLRFQYYYNSDYLDSTKNPYALGGTPHTETILESCLAVMEERLDDIPRGAGPHGIAFAARLATSISIDRRSKAQDLGYNRDGSDEIWNLGWNHWQNPITYNGTLYEGWFVTQANYTVTLGRSLAKALAANNNDSSFASKIPTLTEPVNDGVVDLTMMGQGIEVPTYMRVLPYGLGSNNDAFSMRVIGWKKGGAYSVTMWFPTILCEVACVMGQATGVAKGYVINTEAFADTITIVSEPTITADTTRQGTVIVYSPTNDTVAYFLVPLLGSQKIEFTFDQTTQTPTMNALISAV